jgi:hypothetical protein
MLDLSKVTLVAMASVDIYATIRALMYSSSKINFGKVMLISHKKPWYLPKKIEYKFTSKTKDMYEWCYKIVYNLHEYIETEYIILIHSDGFIVNPYLWRDDFLMYDYVGAPWPIPENGTSYKDANGEFSRVGNSVSLRSKKLLELPSKINLKWPMREEEGIWHEDGFLCCANKVLFEEYGIKYASLDIAKYFSHESMISEIEGIKPFAFHRWSGRNAVYPDFRLKNFFLKRYFNDI